MHSRFAFFDIRNNTVRCYTVNMTSQMVTIVSHSLRWSNFYFLTGKSSVSFSGWIRKSIFFDEIPILPSDVKILIWPSRQMRENSRFGEWFRIFYSALHMSYRLSYELQNILSLVYLEIVLLANFASKWQCVRILLDTPVYYLKTFAYTKI